MGQSVPQSVRAYGPGPIWPSAIRFLRFNIIMSRVAGLSSDGSLTCASDKKRMLKG